MKKLLIICLISSSFMLVGCFNNETKPEVINQVKENKEIDNFQTGSVEVSSGIVENTETGNISNNGVKSNSGIQNTESGNIDSIGIKLEKGSEQYGDYIWKDENGVKYRISNSLSGSKVVDIIIDNNFKLDRNKLEMISLFILKDGIKFNNPKEIVEKYFMDIKYNKYCNLNSVDTEKEITDIIADKNYYEMAYVSKNLFLNKNEWNILYISMNENITSDIEKEEIYNNGYCFGVGFSAPRLYFIFNNDDLSKFLLINNGQDPYPFNPRSIEF